MLSEPRRALAGTSQTPSGLPLEVPVKTSPCMYECMYAQYVCMYVCMKLCMHRWTHRHWKWTHHGFGDLRHNAPLDPPTPAGQKNEDFFLGTLAFHNNL